jgi:hypothetical protein
MILSNRICVKKLRRDILQAPGFDAGSNEAEKDCPIAEWSTRHFFEKWSAQIRQRVFMKRPGRGLQAASRVIAARSREISWQPCNADAEAA